VQLAAWSDSELQSELKRAQAQRFALTSLDSAKRSESRPIQEDGRLGKEGLRGDDVKVSSARRGYHLGARLANFSINASPILELTKWMRVHAGHVTGSYR
jgi:hypothetical protein